MRILQLTPFQNNTQISVPKIVQDAVPFQPVLVQTTNASPVRLYPSGHSNVALLPKVVPPTITAFPNVGAGLPQSTSQVRRHQLLK